MNDTKEKSAVGVGTPATEKDIINIPDDIISVNEEKFKGIGGKKMTEEVRRSIETFEYLQSMPYSIKVEIAKTRIREFELECGIRGIDTHISVGGLDSITLLCLIRSMGYDDRDIPAVSVSTLKDKSIQEVHKKLGVISIKPYKSKVQVLNELGFPVISKAKATKISYLQEPDNPKQTFIHAIMTGDMGEQGHFQHSDKIKLQDKWIKLFGGYYQEHRPDLQCKTAPFKVSSKCCKYMKEDPLDDWGKEHNSVSYLGLMASEGGQREMALKKNGCNYFGKSTIRSCPFATFSRQDLLQLALDLDVPVPKIYGEIKRKDDGTLYTTRAQRTGCSMCGFGIQLEKRPHRFDRLRQDNPKEWEFYMYRCCKDVNGQSYGWGRVLDYIGVAWEDDPFAQLSFEEETK